MRAPRRAPPRQTATLVQALQALVEDYDVTNWWPAREPFEMMVGAVLVQNTRWVNVSTAIHALRRARCLSPSALAKCPPDRLAKLIRSAGCQSVKARRLSSLARWIVAAGGLRRLSAWSTAKLRRELLRVHGIGPETADAILCFAFQRPVFVADQYARRWLQRMGFTPAGRSLAYEAAKRLIEDVRQWSAVDLQDLHAAIVLHAQTVCGRRPDCESCTVRRLCNTYETIR